MAETSWWNPGGTQPPAPSTGPQPLPSSVVRSRAELEKLRDDALAAQPRDPGDARMSWCSPDGVAGALEAIVHTSRWLLGERERAPITRELYDYPDLPVGRIAGRATDAIFEDNSEIPEWYAGGVRRTVEWATNAAKERPIFE
ncbi:hypothetical protein ACFXOL_11055 [Streptomyces californicus]|uniref:hypothetical protein n=1 Tax=Streptomyces californicus TaxID=67351 RepID=UPI00365914F0